MITIIMAMVMYMVVNNVRHDWPEKAGFLISRPNGRADYTFLHFSTTIDFEINGEIIKAQPGACIFYAPGVPQHFHSSQDIIHNWIHTDESLSCMLEKYEIPQNCIIYLNNTAFISEIFRKIELEFYSSNPYKDELIEEYLKEFLIKFSRAVKNRSAPVVIHRKDRDKLRNVRKEILSHPEKRWTVKEMAKLSVLSASRFHAVYKSLFGTSPMRDVIEAKIGYAKSLLLSDEQLTLPEVAEKLGYNDQYHFIRQFKSVTGQTPGVYRKRKEL